MTKYVRSDRDWIARYGGDEFLVFSIFAFSTFSAVIYII